MEEEGQRRVVGGRWSRARWPAKAPSSKGSHGWGQIGLVLNLGLGVQPINIIPEVWFSHGLIGVGDHCSEEWFTLALSAVVFMDSKSLTLNYFLQLSTCKLKIS